VTSPTNKFGFVKEGPAKLKHSTWWGRTAIDVPDKCFLIVSIRHAGRQGHEYVVKGSGIQYVDKRIFSHQEADYLLISVAEQHLSINQTLDKTINFGLSENPTININIQATVRYRVVDREPEVRKALDESLSLDDDALKKLYDNFEEYVKEAFVSSIWNTPICVIKEEVSYPLIGNTIRERLATNGDVYREMAIEILRVDVQGIEVDDLPPLDPPEAEFIRYRGPIDLAPGCRLVTRGAIPEPHLEIKRDHIALMQGAKQLTFTSGLHDMRREPLNDPRNEIIILSLAEYKLSFTIEFNRYFDLKEGTSGYQLCSAGIDLHYRISTHNYNVITFDTAHEIFSVLLEETRNNCGVLMQEAPVQLLQTNSPDLGNYLRQGLRKVSKIEQTGVEVVRVYITDIQIPEGIVMVGIGLELSEPVTIFRIEQLVDPSGERIQIPSGYVGVYRKENDLKLLRSGSQRLSNLVGKNQINPFAEVKLISIDEIPLEIRHTFSPILPLVDSWAQLPIQLTATVYYQPNIPDEDDKGTFEYEDAIDALERLSPNKDLRRRRIENKVKGAIEKACFDDYIALLTKRPEPISDAISRFIYNELSNEGQQVSSVDVIEIEHPPELYDEVMLRHQERIALLETVAEKRRNLIATVSDAEGRRLYAERVPPLTLEA